MPRHSLLISPNELTSHDSLLRDHVLASPLICPTSRWEAITEMNTYELHR